MNRIRWKGGGKSQIKKRRRRGTAIIPYFFAHPPALQYIVQSVADNKIRRGEKRAGKQKNNKIASSSSSSSSSVVSAITENAVGGREGGYGFHLFRSWVGRENNAVISLLSPFVLFSTCSMYTPQENKINWRVCELVRRVCTERERDREGVCACVCVCVCVNTPSCFFSRGEKKESWARPPPFLVSSVKGANRASKRKGGGGKKRRRKGSPSPSPSPPPTPHVCLLVCVLVSPFLPLLFFHTQSRRRRRKGEGEKGEEAPLFSLWYISCPPPPLSSSPGSFRPFSLPLCHRQVVRGNLPAEEEEEEEAPRNRETHFSAEQWSDGNKRSEMRSSV